MKKRLLTIAMIGTLVLQGFGQSKVIIPASQYDVLKAKGKLDKNAVYVLVDDGHSTLPANTGPLAAGVSGNRTMIQSVHPKGGVACSCLIPNVDTDPSFSVADFVGGTAPDYRSDDNSTPMKTTAFDFCLYGTVYSGFYINNNGNLSFGGPNATYSPGGFPDPTNVMVAPFWGDVDTRNTASGVVYYKITPTYAIIQWKNVGYYNMEVNRLNTFQVIITDGSDPILPAGDNIAFCYGDMEWTSGDASGGTLGLNGVPSTVGLNAGNGVNYIQLGRFDHAGLGYDGAYGANDGVNWLSNQSFYLNGCNGTNVAPIASGINNCDTIKICGMGDSILIHPIFLSPEAGQTTTISINLNSTPGASIVSNTPGNTASAVVQVVASALNAGANYITFTATDNGSPVGVTTVNALVYVDTTAFGPTPSITGTLGFCQGDSTLLSVTPTTFSTYLWSNGTDQTTTYATHSGPYFVTTTLNGCTKTSSVNVVEHPTPSPAISGYPYTCAGGNTTLTVDSLIYATYNWSTSSTATSITVPNGNYSVTVTDAFGCVGSSPTLTVTAAVPPVITGQTSVCNGSLANLTTTYAYASYNWLPGGITNDTATVAAGTYTVHVVDIHGCSLTSAPFTVNNFTYNLNVTGNMPYCAGQTLTLTAASTSSPVAVPTYHWTPGGAGANTTVSAGGIYIANVTYPNGCSKDTAVVVAPPHPLPTPVITGPLFVCGGGTTTLGVDSAYVTYLWSNAATSATNTVGTGPYYVTVTDAIGCVGSSPTATVVSAIPTVTISGNHPLCNGSSEVLTATASIAAGASYLWSTTATTPTITTSTAGNTVVHVNYANGCTASDSVTVVVVPLPTIMLMTNDTLMTALSATATYQWLNCNTGYSTVAGATNNWYASSGSGSYAVMVTNNGCVDTTNCISFAGINEFADANVYTISPNPTNGAINIMSSNYKITSVKMYDVLGQIIYNTSVENKQCTIDMSTFAKGMYFVQILTEKGIVSRKVEKQ
jgi:hypothetical protein